ncbi:MAG: DNA-directed RNA polymerase subunit K/omega [Saprospiraceae bacterium]|jgi:DNA-directed RNA polymerase subunit K/omega
MDYKKTKAFNSTITRDVTDFSKGKNIYELIAILGKRADQIGLELKEELNSKLEEFASPTDNLEEIFENREQIEISKFYERLPKPTLIASQEWSDDEIYHRNPNTENKDAE